MADDYMSDAFLVDAQDVKPGLSRSLTGKRKLDAYKRQSEAVKINRRAGKDRKLNATETLKKGLETNVISEENPGFKMMKMMGYKTGCGLGKGGEGISEPIKIDPFKDGKSGLGQETKIKEECRKRIKFETARREAFKRNETQMLAQFRRSKMTEAGDKFIARTVKRCQSMCQQMDERCGYTPTEPWFWPPPPPQPTEGEEEDELEYWQPDDASLLPSLNDYLRYTHYYCVWCGVKYTDPDDLNGHCPGPEQAQHDEQQDDTDFAY